MVDPIETTEKQLLVQLLERIEALESWVKQQDKKGNEVVHGDTSGAIIVADGIQGMRRGE